MTDEQIQNYFTNSVIYKFVGKLDVIKDRQKQAKNNSMFLKDGRNVYFVCQKPCNFEDVVVAFDTTIDTTTETNGEPV